MKHSESGQVSAYRSYRFPSESSVIREYDIAVLDDNQDNHFHRMEGSQWEEFVGSIRSYGVVSPLLIRPKPGCPGRYEILAGHNRKCGAAEAGLTTVPCIAVDADDVDASVLIGITNRQREEVSDLEWGWTYRTTLDMLKAQRARSRKGTGTDERSIDLVARKYGVNRKTVRRKIRLTYLVPQLYDLGLRMSYPQKMMVAMSYLPPAVQINIVQAAVIENVVISEGTVAALRGEAEARDLAINDVLQICRRQAAEESSDETGASGGRRERRRAKIEVASALFPASLPAARRQAYVTAALEYIRDHHIDLSVG